jgi:hypothetical protein
MHTLTMNEYFQIAKTRLATYLCLCLIFQVPESFAAVVLHNSQIENDRALIVVHPFSDWDLASAAKPSIDILISFHKRAGLATVYVLDGHGTKGLYLEDMKPTYFVDAPSGQFFNSLAGQTFFFAGGSWSYCLSNAMTSVIANTVSDNLAFTVFTDASFEFMQEENIARSLNVLTPDSRKTLLLAHFNAITKRAGADVCMDIFYERIFLGTTSGSCRRKGIIYLDRVVQK